MSSNVYLYGTVTAKSEDCTPNAVIEYYLTETDIRPEYCDLKKYGIIITKRTIGDPSGTRTETKRVEDVFYRLSDARRFLDMAMEDATPPAMFSAAVKRYMARVC